MKGKANKLKGSVGNFTVWQRGYRNDGRIVLISLYEIREGDGVVDRAHDLNEAFRKAKRLCDLARIEDEGGFEVIKL